jgi:hypothetical protein
MLYPEHPLAKKLADLLASGELKASEVATACGVSDQAVNGWKKTGRIAKEHLPTLALMSRRPLDWWLEGLSKDRPVRVDKFDRETLDFASEFAKLGAPGRAKFRALLLLSTEGATDEQVERKMPATGVRRKAGEKDRSRNEQKDGS